MRFKKPIASLLAAAMMLSSLPMLAFADDDDPPPVAVPVPVRDVCEDESHTSTVMVVASGNASRHEVHCATCDKLAGDGSEDHNREASDETPVSNGASGHTIKCKHCTITWTEPHDTNGADGKCSVCGYSDEVAPAVPVEPVDPADCDHEHTTTMVATGYANKHEEYCNTCYSKQSEHNREASDDSPVSQNASGHTIKCKHCTITWTEPHDTNGADGACSICGYDDALAPAVPVDPVDPADCDHAVTHTIVATGYANKHEEYCNTCYSKQSEHNREASDDSPVSRNASGHTIKCKHCTITWTEPHDTNGVGGACSVCGYKAATSESGGSNSGTSGTSGGGSSSTSTTTTPTVITAATTTKFASTPREIRNSNKSNVTVNAAETKVTPAMVTAFTKNKKAKTMTLDYGTKMKVVVSKSDVKNAAKADLDFSVSGKNFISSKTINKSKTLSKAEKIVQIEFVKDGKINGIDKVTIKNRIGKNYAGQKAVVYEYVDGKLVKVAATKVNGSGYVNFKIDHLGKYIIAVE